jgi:hypothetical protein
VFVVVAAFVTLVPDEAWSPGISVAELDALTGLAIGPSTGVLSMSAAGSRRLDKDAPCDTGAKCLPGNTGANDLNDRGRITSVAEDLIDSGKVLVFLTVGS